MSATPATGLIQVLIADDHEPTREDIRRTLERDPRFSICGEVADAAAAVARAIEVRPDIVLLDIRMPGSGLTALWEIASRLPDTRIVMLTVSEEESDLFAALRAGAHGYLLKDMDPRRLPEALYDVHEGTTAVPRRLVSVMMEEFRDGNPRRRALTATSELEGRLTSREWQVLDLMRQGLSTAEIGRRLFLSQTTVRTHIAAVVKKLGVDSREAAVRLFDEQR